MDWGLSGLWWTTLENIQDELECLGSMDLSFESIIVWKGICELFSHDNQEKFPIIIIKSITSHSLYNILGGARVIIMKSCYLHYLNLIDINVIIFIYIYMIIYNLSVYHGVMVGNTSFNLSHVPTDLFCPFNIYYCLLRYPLQ